MKTIYDLINKLIQNNIELRIFPDEKTGFVDFSFTKIHGGLSFTTNSKISAFAMRDAKDSFKEDVVNTMLKHSIHQVLKDFQDYKREKKDT